MASCADYHELFMLQNILFIFNECYIAENKAKWPFIVIGKQGVH